MDSETQQLFQKSDQRVLDTYSTLLADLHRLGDFSVEAKKTSLHVTRRAAFLGIHPKVKWLDIQIVTEAPLESPRVSKVEQVSRNRFHNQVRLGNPSEVDGELTNWVKQAYDLMA